MSDTSANAVAFVRTESVPASAPPVNAAGPVKWLKDNLFDGVGNSILTVLAFVAIFLILSNTMPWAIGTLDLLLMK